MKDKQGSLFEPELGFTNRSVRDVTFQGKLSQPIHRWYRLTPSFSPQLAHDIADHFTLSEGDYVLDPFSGVGTVPLCMKYRGISACSVELNPYLRFVSHVKTRTYPDLDSPRVAFGEFIERFSTECRVPKTADEAAELLEENREYVPAINYPERWWSPGNLGQIAKLRRMVSDLEQDYATDLIKMAVASILIPVSNAKHNRVSLTYAEKPLPTVDVAQFLSDKCEDIFNDLEEMRTRPCADVTVYAGNSKELSKVLPKATKPTAVITSPPYPNRFSYARETRPHLFFLDLMASPAAVGEMETDAIGGTWGKATSVLSAGVEPANDLIKESLGKYTKDINGSGPLMAHYVTKYFNNLYTHAGEVAKVCAKKAKLAYVIGNSKFYDHPLPSDEILAEIFADFGFKLSSIEKMRKRQSKNGLYEAVVFMERR
jgi:hypothetical protein